MREMRRFIEKLVRSSRIGENVKNSKLSILVKILVLIKSLI